MKRVESEKRSSREWREGIKRLGRVKRDHKDSRERRKVIDSKERP